MGGQLIQRQLVGRLESGALFFCDVRDRGGREVAQLPCADGKISRLAGRAGGRKTSALVAFGLFHRALTE